MYTQTEISLQYLAQNSCIHVPCMLGNQHLIKKKVSGIMSNSLVQIRPDILSGLILVQTVEDSSQFKAYMYVMTFEPVHEISNNVVCATSKASDQPAHRRSLIRALASLLSIL